MPAKRTRQKSRTLNHGSAPKRARVGNLAVTTDAPESNDAPELPNANALLPTAFNLLRQLGVNPSGLLNAEVIKLQKQISLNATANVAEPVAAAIKGKPSATNCKLAHCEHHVVDKTGIEAHDVVLGAKNDLQALTEHHERVDAAPSGPTGVEEQRTTVDDGERCGADTGVRVVERNLDEWMSNAASRYYPTHLQSCALEGGMALDPGQILAPCQLQKRDEREKSEEPVRRRGRKQAGQRATKQKRARPSLVP
ncbi:hypothetical protein B0H17DRAFT_1134042 [Mycena rosella]|uniref:Uncharacterized protein n=1 Tax=Mycena rosella TaxID=1033263 RepID=A0AAD7DGC2_MYCRO|nr:hypothetical protein B0H17DRAFT_1134042 [Mycena rosella]